MTTLVRRAVTWVDDRTGLEQACQRFLSEKIPASAGWPQVFGSVTLFLLFVQALTGVLLAVNFAPTPNEAHQSIRYIVREVSGGRFVHSLHHWGSSLVIIATVVHMTQVFLYRAYKKPRELTWMIGTVLLLVVLGFGLTGYLLPWDNRAYWGTMVTTQIMSSVPVIGSIVARLAGASDRIGDVTFARFYTLHTILLPAAVSFLVCVHVYLVRRHGVAARGDVSKSRTFYPHQAIRDLVAVFISFVLLATAAAFLDVPLGRLADPTDALYTPRPEWYFLFLFQILKLFSGRMEWIGTTLLPTLAVLLLFSMPFLAGRIRLDRILPATAFAVCAFSIWATLTLEAYAGSPHRKVSVPSAMLEWAQVTPEEIAGFGYFQFLHCGSCHNLITGPPKAGPNLPGSGPLRPGQWIAEHSKSSDAEANHAELSLTKLNALAIFLAKLTPEASALIQDMSPGFVRGAQVYVESACSSCHKVNGAGGGMGPSLDGLAERRSREWVIAHFANPRKLSPASTMPPFRFSREDQNAILLYLFSLSD